MYNKLLQTQVKKHLGSMKEIPKKLLPVFKMISDCYDDNITGSAKDQAIDQLQKENEELKRTHNELKKLFEEIDEVLYSVDMVSYKLIQMSSAAEKIYGYTAEEFLTHHDLWEKVVHPEDKDISRKQVQLLYQGKQVFNQYRIIRKDKSIRWIENKIIPTLDKNGTLIRLDGITGDISERKIAEKELEKSFSILKATIESTADGILVTDFTGKIVRFNKKCAELWRIPEEILSGGDDQKALDYVLVQLTNPEDFVNRISEIYKNKKEASFDLLYFKDGRVYERYSTPHLIHDNCVGRVWSFRDITARNFHEEALRESEKRLRQIIDLVPHFIFAKDTEGKFILANEAVAKAFGCSVEDVIGKNDSDFSSTEEEIRHFINEDMEVIKSGNAKYNIEERITDAAGNVMTLSTTKIPYKSFDADTVGILGVSVDITERKKAEETLRISEANLELKNKELELKNKELEQFAYVASHDLQEPLRTTSSFTELLQRQYKGKLDEKADNYLTFIRQSSDRMKVLIKDLLDYSRIGGKKQKEKVDCNIILQQVLADLDVAIKETSTVIDSRALPVFNGYPTEIKLLFQNLIINAIKFRKKDIAPQIKIDAIRNNGHWEFMCNDNGIGINQEHSERIFIIFQRLHTRNEYEGSGIGLAHCKKIVELHGGKIWTESVPGEGSTFYFTIPAKNN